MSLVSELAEKLLMAEEELLRFALTMPRRYKKYSILKRSGNGLRLIAQPSQEAKFIQRMIVDELRKSLPVHRAAMAYEKGTGIRLNALQHKDSRYLLKMDFKNFFPSITPELFFLVSGSCGVEFNGIERAFLENALFFRNTRRSKLRLSIGAPSSPFVSNFVMFKFDEYMAEYCVARQISYTRYADDLTFTSNRKGILFEIPVIVDEFLKKFVFRKVRVNSEKTVFSSKAFNRHVTGIVLTNDAKLSVGRLRKREIASLINSYRFGKLDAAGRLRLKGLLSFAHHIEPDFISRMKSKYSVSLIDEVLRSDHFEIDKG